MDKKLLVIAIIGIILLFPILITNVNALSDSEEDVIDLISPTVLTVTTIGGGGGAGNLSGTDPPFLYNNQDTVFFNATLLNITIDKRNTNASTACSNNEVLLGNGTCHPITKITGSADTNESIFVSNLYLDDCGGTDKVTGVLPNGTIVCGADADTGGINTWELNLSNGVSSDLTVGTYTISLGNETSFWDKLYIRLIRALDWSNVTITESQVSDLVHTVDTNESTFVSNIHLDDCDGTDKVTGVLPNGTIVCNSDDTGSGDNPFDQNLNTTEFVRFITLNLTNWNNVTIVESQISDLLHTVDTNESIFVSNLHLNDCQGTDKITGVLLNGTVVCATDLNGGNATFNQSLTDTLYASILFNHNQSDVAGRVFWYNQSQVAGSIFWYNHTLATLTSLTNSCDGTDKITGILGNGTIVCGADLDTGGINTWELNLSNGISGNLTAGTYSTSLGNETSFWNTLYVKIVRALDWSNVTITESQVSDLVHTTDTNESIFVSNLHLEDCGGTDKVTGVLPNGTIVCSTDETGSGDSPFDQNLNTTENVKFITLNLTNWNNVTIVESQISDLTHTIDTDTNESTFVSNLHLEDCGGTDKVTGVFLNGTVVCATDVSGGNSTFNQSFTDGLYASIIWNYNQSDVAGRIFWFNQTIGANTFTNSVANATFNQSFTDAIYASIIFDYNETIGTLNSLSGNCLGTNKVAGILANGTINCTADVDTGGINTWELNLTQGVSNNLTAGIFTISLGNETSFWDTLYVRIVRALDWSNVTITESQVSDLVHTIDTDTNESIFVSNIHLDDCDGTDKVTGVLPNGTIVCNSDDTGSGDNPFDQNLNTTEFVRFITLNLTNWNNVTIVESQISDLLHTVDTNESIFVSNLHLNDCQGTDKITGVLLNGTVVCATDVSGGNSTFNQSFTDGLYASILFNHNQSDVAGRIFWFNQTIGANTFTNSVANATFNQSFTDAIYASIIFDYNETIGTLNSLSGNCLGTNKVAGILANGTINCTADVDTGGINTWELNLTQGVSNNLTAGIFTISLGNETSFWDTLYVRIVRALDWSNVTITESQVSDLVHTIDTDTNESIFVSNLYLDACTGTDKMSGVLLNGTVNCTLDLQGSSDNPFDQNLNTTESVTFVDLTVSGTANITTFITPSSGLKFNFFDDGSNILFNVSNGGGDFSIEQENSKITLINSPTAGNDFKVFQVFSKEASDVTEFVVTKAGPAFTSYFIRSLSLPGNSTTTPTPHNCSTYANFIDCQTDLTGPDLYVQDDVEIRGRIFLGTNGRINSTDDGNLSAKFFIGDGSLLTNLAGFTDTNASTTCNGGEVLLGNGTCQNSSTFFDDTTIGNESTFVGNLHLDVCTGTDKVTGVLPNGTVVCSTDLNGGNATFNQSLTDTLYASILFNHNQSDVAGRIFWFNQSDVAGRVFWFNQTIGARTYTDSVANSTFNQSLTDSLYITTDTNASTACNGAEVLLGNGSCQATSPFLSSSVNCNSSGSCSGGDVAYMDFANIGAFNVSGNLSVGVGAKRFDLFYNGSSVLFDTLGNNAIFLDNVTAKFFIGDGSLLTNLAGFTNTWELNLSNGVSNNLTAGTYSTSLGTETSFWNTLYVKIVRALDWSNVTITESQVSDLTHRPVTNIAFLNNTQTFTQENTFSNNVNITGVNNLSMGNARTYWNGTCLNTEVGGTVVMSIGCQ